MDFLEKLNTIVARNNSLVCVGLDSDIDKIPSVLKSKKHPQFEFNRRIIDATHDLVCAYKPNCAFYEGRGAEGFSELKMTCDYINNNYPEIPVILDAKRGDIGNTNNGYAKFAFAYLGVDAITVQPYLGAEAIKPFLEYKDKGIIILCRTSNPGAGEFQDLMINIADSGCVPSGLTRMTNKDSGPFDCAGGKQARMTNKIHLYQIIAEKVTKKWNYNNNCLLVVGATYPQELKKVRKIAGEMVFLVPGVGVQGGELEAVLKNGLTVGKKGLIINSSRGIIFASSGDDFADCARNEALSLKNSINKYR